MNDAKYILSLHVYGTPLSDKWISLLATRFRNFRLMERRQRLARKADCQASPSAGLARYAGRPP